MDFEPEGAEQHRQWREENRRDSVRHGWAMIDWVAGRDPHLSAPGGEEHKVAVERAVKALLHGSHGR